MQRFKKILLVSDEVKGRLALERAFALAKRNKAHLAVVEVVDKLSRDHYMLITTITSQELQDISAIGFLMHHLKASTDDFFGSTHERNHRIKKERFKNHL